MSLKSKILAYKKERKLSIALKNTTANAINPNKANQLKNNKK
ncbi:hypothetical protein [Mucilaginibacter sp. L196]|nr:hypothetical protein [Mucilaginibacter sp. L196]